MYIFKYVCWTCFWNAYQKMWRSCHAITLDFESTFQIDVFVLKCRSILKVDFQYWCVYFQTQKYTLGKISKFMYLCFVEYIWVYLK